MALGIIGVLYGIVLHLADTMSTAEKNPEAMAALLALVTEHRKALFETTAENVGRDLTPVAALAWVDQFEATVKAWKVDGTI